MSVPEITIPNEAERLRDAYNRRGSVTTRVPVDDGQKYAVALIKLAGAVTPEDLPALGTAINGITGITGITLCARHQAEAEPGDGFGTVVHVTTHARIDAE